VRWPSEGVRRTVVPRRLRRLRTDLGGWSGGYRLGRHHPVTYGRWDAAAQAHQSKEDTQRNNAAVPFYYADGALDPVTTRKAVAEFGKPVLSLACEYDVGLPPRNAAEYAGLSSSMPSWWCSPAPGTFLGLTIPCGSRGHWRPFSADRVEQ
jgi:hypothetical protein